MSESVQIQGFDYPIVSKSINDIISEINFDSEEDKILCKDIVQFVEGNAAAYLLTDRAVLVPFNEFSSSLLVGLSSVGVPPSEIIFSLVIISLPKAFMDRIV